MKRIFSMILMLVIICGVISWQAAAAGDGSGPEIRNVIIMIPDGGGFGNFDLAEAIKLTGIGVDGARTPLTTDAIAGENHEGMYLSDYLVASSKTHSANRDITDSAAGGTAIATGHKVNNLAVAETPKGLPTASVLEASQIAGKATGLVTTSYWFDATPASFSSHATEHGEYGEITRQMLMRGMNIVLGGSPAESHETDGSQAITAESLGYTVVNDRAELEDTVSSGGDHVWSNFGEFESTVPRDCDASDKPTLLEMSKAAITLLSENVNDEDGFFLMIEGGCVDKGAHGSNAVTAAAEYLAFDETFAYVVNWARGRDDTIVVGVPDHDTGGLDVLDIEGAVRSVQSLVNPTDVIWNGDGNHTSQNVGIWLYAPDGARNTFLNAAGIPTDTAPDKVRSGKFYSGTVFNEDYAIENCDIIRGVEAVSGLSLSDATDELFARLDVSYSYRDGKYILNDSGIVLPLNCSYYVMPNGDKVNFEYGVTVRPENPPKLCVPRHILNKLRRTILPFNDVTKEDWFYGAVSKVYFDELMDGTAHDTFAPEKRMTRAELVTVIARLSGDDVSGMGSKLTYIDTPQNKWYSDYIGWASSEGIVNGYGDGSFRPDSPVSRQELAVIIDRYANATDAEFEAVPIIDDFRDRASFPSWSADAIENMRVAGIVGGDPSGNYNPGSTGTRAELATILSRYSGNLK